MMGGVTDLITEKTGWPIKNVDNVRSYCNAIGSILKDYPKALERSAQLRTYTLSRCNEEKFRNDAIAAFNLEK